MTKKQKEPRSYYRYADRVNVNLNFERAEIEAVKNVTDNFNQYVRIAVMQRLKNDRRNSDVNK